MIGKLNSHFQGHMQYCAVDRLTSKNHRYAPSILCATKFLYMTNYDVCLSLRSINCKIAVHLFCHQYEFCWQFTLRETRAPDVMDVQFFLSWICFAVTWLGVKAPLCQISFTCTKRSLNLYWSGWISIDFFGWSNYIMLPYRVAILWKIWKTGRSQGIQKDLEKKTGKVEESLRCFE